MGDVEDYLLVEKKKPYPSARQLARKRDAGQRQREKKRR